MTSLIDLDEFLYVVDQNKLMGKGIGFVVARRKKFCHKKHEIYN
jgi:hypothetical protein